MPGEPEQVEGVLLVFRSEKNSTRTRRRVNGVGFVAACMAACLAAGMGLAVGLSLIHI